MRGVFMLYKRIQRQKRIVVLTLLILFIGFALLGRVFQLQILQGTQYARIAVTQRSLRYDYKPSGRGQILDRTGVSLLDTQWKPVTVLFEPILDMETRAILHKHPGYNRNTAVHVFDADHPILGELGDVPRDGVIQAIEEDRYGQNSLASHVTGYIQKSGANPPVRLERAFNEELSIGQPFSLAAIVDARGNLVEGLGYRDWRGDDPARPYSIITTIDSQIQAAVEQALQTADKSGAVVVMDPTNGDILAMASYPEIKPALLYTGLSATKEAQIEKEAHRQHHVNKATESYEPGSVFKVVLAAAALENGLITETYECTGAIELSDNTSISCFNDYAHGEVNLHQALTVSCNGYFVWLGQKLGRQTLQEKAEAFKLGTTTGIPLGESAGNIPSPEEMPYLGDLGNVSIGQGDVLVTPLQITRMMATIVNNGRDVYPRLVSEIIDTSGNTVREFPVYTGTTVIHPAVARNLKSMLTDVVELGTGRDAYSEQYTTGGKTGTAETAVKDEHHSWFTGFVETSNKPLIVTVFMHGSENGRAIPIFNHIVRQTSR